MNALWHSLPLIRGLSEQMRRSYGIYQTHVTIGDSVYGANDAGIYRLQNETNTWEQIAPEILGVVTSLVVDEDTFYVGTERRGVLRFERVN